MRRLLDTSVLIDVLRGEAAAVEFLLTLESAPICSEITRIEVTRGLRSQERRPADRLFGELLWRPIDEPVARRAGELGRAWRRSHPGIASADLAIAATAELDAAELATSNVKHFPMIDDLQPPYRLRA